MRLRRANDDSLRTLWNEAYRASRLADMPFAIEQWKDMLGIDPMCGDALLALHSVGSYLPNHVERLCDSVDSVGEFGPLGSHTSAYCPLGFTSLVMQSKRDILACGVTVHVNNHNFEAADELLARLDSNDVVVAAVRANYCRAKDEWKEAIIWAQKAFNCTALQFDVRLMLAQGYYHIGMPEVAIHALEEYLDAAPNATAQKFAKYMLGHSYNALGNPGDARAYWLDIFAVDSEYFDVPQLLGFDSLITTSQEKVAMEQSWSELVGQLESDELADDPEILDNGAL